MGINAHITDISNGFKAKVVNHEEYNALVVATRPLKTYNNKVLFFINPTYGSDMAVNAGFAGTPQVMYKENAGEATEWTSSAITGIWDFASTAYAHAGTKSIDGTAAGKNEIMQLANDVDVDLGGYTAITGWIYLNGAKPSVPSDFEIVGYDTGTTSEVGISVNIQDYIDVNTRNTWQKFAIRLEDMALDGQTLDAFRINHGGTGSPDNPYLDDIQLEESGSIEYLISPGEGTWLHVNTISIIMASAYSGITTVADATENATLPNIPYDSFLNNSFDIGVLYRRIVNEEVVFSLPSKHLFDLMTYPNAQLLGYGSDGTNTWLKVRNVVSEPLTLKAEDGDVLSMVISEDFSVFSKFQVSVSSSEETR